MARLLDLAARPAERNPRDNHRGMILMAKEIAAGVVGSLLTALLLWAFGYIGKKAGQIPMPSYAVVAFNQESCPEGWKLFEPGRGRYIVGLTKDGDLGETVGVKLGNRENRAAGSHTHSLKDATLGGNVKDGLGGGGYDRKRTASYMTDPNEAPEGTNAPYIQLLLCEKR